MKLKRYRKILNEFYTMVRFGLVGLSNTAVFAICVWLISLTGIHYTLYTAISYFLAFFYSFTMNRLFTFQKTTNSHMSMFIRFLIVALVLMVIVQIIQWLMIELVRFPEWVGIGAGMIFYSVTGYIVNRLWVFRNRQSRKSHNC